MIGGRKLDIAASGAGQDAAAQADVRAEIRAEIRAQIEAEVRQFLSGFRARGRGSLARLAGSRNLWREVSSLTLLQLVTFLEQRFAITVRPIDFAPQNFADISAIARFVAVRIPDVDPR